jgi:hypothetical protein
LEEASNYFYKTEEGASWGNVTGYSESFVKYTRYFRQICPTAL